MVHELIGIEKNRVVINKKLKELQEQQGTQVTKPDAKVDETIVQVHVSCIVAQNYDVYKYTFANTFHIRSQAMVDIGCLHRFNLLQVRLLMFTFIKNTYGHIYILLCM